jgi:AraC-like DNA-binding protein
MAIAVKATGTGTITQGRHHQALNPGDMFIIDQTCPNDYAATSAGVSRTIIIDYNALGIDVEHVRNASLVLPHSPMYRMFRAHLSELFRIVDHLAYDEAIWSTLTASSLSLAQVLVTTAAGNTRASGDALRASQIPRMDLYIRQHLRDRDLTAAKIAYANHMSIRRLYSIWAAREVSLAEHIMACRLRGASRDLLRQELPARSVTELASSWGFVSAAHFSKRFKAAYGVSPLQWRQLAGSPS